MKVIGIEGRHVGFVKEIEGDHLVIGRPAATDIRVPLTDCRITPDNVVKLNIPANQIDGSEWANAGLEGFA